MMFIFLNALQGNFIAALIASLVMCGLAGFMIDFVGLKPLRKKNAPRMAGIISTLGLGTVIDNAIQIWIGTDTKPFPNYLDFGKIYIGNAVISYTQIIILCTCVVLMAILTIVVYTTKIGKSMRAVSQDIDCAKLMGVNVQLVISATFIVSAALACVSGAMVGSYYQNIDTLMGFSVGMKTFAAAVLGGPGSFPGAMLGGLIVGMAETMGASYISSGYRDAIAFAILILVLIFKPSGLLGKQSIHKM